MKLQCYSTVNTVEMEMNLQQINQQSLRLAKLTLLILFAIALYFTWADLISATSYLESVTLWHYEGSGLNAGEAVPISVGDILGALVTVILTLTLARNLPGLLEILGRWRKTVICKERTWRKRRRQVMRMIRDVVVPPDCSKMAQKLGL